MRTVAMAAVAFLLLATAALGAGQAVRPSSGGLDPSFAGDGMLTQDFAGFSETAHAVVVTRTGEIITAIQRYPVGDFDHRTNALVRYRDDGSLAGVAGVPLRELLELVELRDGKLLALGTARNSVAAMRMRPDGTPDPGFGAEGLTVIPRHKLGWPDCMDGRHAAEMRDGRIVIAGVRGCGGEAGGPMGTFVARLLADGRLDRSFANRGVRLMGACAAAGVAVRRRGKIIIATGTGTDEYCDGGAMKVTRLRPDGRPDPGFGTHGRVQVRFPGADDNYPYAFGVDGRRRIIVAGAAGRHVGVARLTRSGKLDRSFGDDGRAIRRLRRRSYATSAAVSAGGAVTVTVDRLTDAEFWTTAGFIVLRFAADGRADSAFGTGGLQELSFGTEFAEADDVALDAQGRTVAVGYAYSQQSGTANDVVIARLR